MTQPNPMTSTQAESMTQRFTVFHDEATNKFAIYDYAWSRKLENHFDDFSVAMTAAFDLNIAADAGELA